MKTLVRRLSTGATTFWKSIFPPAWITGVGAFNVALWMDLIGSHPAPMPVKVAALSLWVAFSPFFIWWSRRLHHVWLDGDELVLKPGGREFRIGLSEIRAFKESRFQRVKLITLELGRPSPVGDKIVFVAPLALQKPFGDHPLVEELKERKVQLAGARATHRLGEPRG